MRAVVYSETGGPEVLRLVDRAEPEAGTGEVVVRVAVSGVNPSDWKVRTGSRPGEPTRSPETVPNQDGAGTIVAVGAGVESTRVGERVWIWEAAWHRSDGTAQELVAIPTEHAVSLPANTSFDLGASLGIPALTAHRALTVGALGPDGLGPETLFGRTVLVAGGAGAVGHAAIQLAKWSGATVITTVSSPEKAALARAAGADHVLNYRTDDVAAAVREIAPDGVDIVVEVAPVTNIALDAAVVARDGTVAIYASEGDDPVPVPVRDAMVDNIRYQFILVYTMPDLAKRRAVRDVSSAVSAGALDVGEDAGLPLHRFPLERTADAHAAVEAGAVGKVLIDLL
ncbi:MAG: NADPH:quinone reductase [Actinomycetota bacterium]|jgi:NADPH2:quinone reductase|nr:NADPH:quinone reductase [Actinomycetota bacterium]